MHCCTRNDALATDDRFAEDDFTSAALAERRAHAAHSHFGALVLATIAGVFFVGFARMICGGRRA